MTDTARDNAGDGGAGVVPLRAAARVLYRPSWRACALPDGQIECDRTGRTVRMRYRSAGSLLEDPAFVAFVALIALAGLVAATFGIVSALHAWPADDLAEIVLGVMVIVGWALVVRGVARVLPDTPRQFDRYEWVTIPKDGLLDLAVTPRGVRVVLQWPLERPIAMVLRPTREMTVDALLTVLELGEIATHHVPDGAASVLRETRSRWRPARLDDTPDREANDADDIPAPTVATTPDSSAER